MWCHLRLVKSETIFYFVIKFYWLYFVQLRQVIDTSTFIMTWIFLAEMLIKVRMTTNAVAALWKFS